MREIKFRAWDNWDKEMHSGVNAFDGETVNDIFTDARYTFMQYTGLKDKNGKEIYEGDIVHAWDRGVEADLLVKWGNGAARFFLWRKKGGLIWNLSGGGLDYVDRGVEVIGNIYENPEMAEQKESEPSQLETKEK